MIVKFTVDRKDQWDLFLDTCVFAYNTAKHKSTLYSPFELMFGRKAVLPIDVIHERKDQTDLLKEYISTKDVTSLSVHAQFKYLLYRFLSLISFRRKRYRCLLDRLYLMMRRRSNLLRKAKGAV